ncbi:MAG: transposase [Planctomycetaceae bacterium]
MANNGTNDNAGDGKRRRRRFTKEFKEEAVQMLKEGLSATSVAERLGLSGPSLLYSWKRQLIGQAGKTAATLESRGCSVVGC